MFSVENIFFFAKTEKLRVSLFLVLKCSFLSFLLLLGALQCVCVSLCVCGFMCVSEAVCVCVRARSAHSQPIKWLRRLMNVIRGQWGMV